MANASQRRTRYVSSGKVCWLYFIPWSIVTLVVSVMGGVIFWWISRWGYHVLVGAPGGVFLLVWPILYAAIKKGKCRNLGVVLGLVTLACVTMYLAFFLSAVVYNNGWEGTFHFKTAWQSIVHQVRFEKYVIAKEVVIDIGKVKENCALLGLEFFFLWACSLALAWECWHWPYCETHQRWMKRKTSLFPLGSSKAMLAALENHDLQAWKSFSPLPADASLPLCRARFYYAAQQKGFLLPGFAYFDTQEFPQNPPEDSSNRHWALHVFGFAHVTPQVPPEDSPNHHAGELIELTPEEVQHVLTWFPDLDTDR